MMEIKEINCRMCNDSGKVMVGFIPRFCPACSSPTKKIIPKIVINPDNKNTEKNGNESMEIRTLHEEPQPKKRGRKPKPKEWSEKL